MRQREDKQAARVRIGPWRISSLSEQGPMLPGATRTLKEQRFGSMPSPGQRAIELLLAQLKRALPDPFVRLAVNVARVANGLRVFRGDFRQEGNFFLVKSEVL